MKTAGRVLTAFPILFSCTVAAAQPEPVELSYRVLKTLSTLYDKSGPDPLKWRINSPDGLAWDGTGLWVSACDSKVFSKLDVDTGKLIKEVSLPAADKVDVDHMVWDGRYLWGAVHSMPWYVGAPDGRLIQIDTDAKRIVKTIDVPFRDKETMTPMGMAWDGTYIWSTDVKERLIYRMDPDTGAGKDMPLYATPASPDGPQITPCGITYDFYGCLWITDLSLGKVYGMDAKSGEVVAWFDPPENPDPAKYGQFRPPSVKKLFTGHATDGKRNWIVDEIEGNPLIYELDIDFPTTGRCAHPVAFGAACVPGGQPFCDSASVCYAEGGNATCHAKCGGPTKVCAAGTVCQAKPDVGEVCVAGAPAAFGEPCVGDAACQDGVCIIADGQSAGRCSRSCQAAGDCPGGYTCGARGDARACLAAPSSSCSAVPAARAHAMQPLLLLGAGLLLGTLVRRSRRRRGC